MQIQLSPVETNSNMKNVVFLVFLLASCGTGAKLPSSFIKCTYGTPDLNECLSKALEKVLSLLTQPLRKVGLPSLDPFNVVSATIGEGTGPVQVVENFKNLKIYGLTNLETKATQSSLEPDNFFFKFSVLVPEVKFLAEYSLNGKVMIMPIQGEGNSTVILTNVTGVVYFPFEKFHNKGETYIRVRSDGSVEVTDVDLLYIHFDNLYNGNKELGETTNKVLNDNWRAIFDDVKSGYDRVLTEIAVNVANGFFARVPLKEIMNNLPQKLLE